MKSDEPITPKASQRVIDGEVVDDASYQSDPSRAAQDKRHLTKTASKWWPQTFMQKLMLLLVLTLMGLGSFWVWQSNQQDWQIEHINQLQSQLKTLKNLSDEHQQKLQQHAQKIAQLSSSEQKPVVSQADLDQLNQELTALKEQLKSQISEFSTGLTRVSEQVMQSSKKGLSAVTPSDEQQAKVQQIAQDLETKFKQELSQMQSKVAELFDFKSAQQSVNETVDQVVNQSKEGDAPAVLSDSQRQQWITQINTQWLLGAEPDPIQQQLKALEQAAAISDWPQKNSLLRQIGADLAQLNQVQINAEKKAQAKQAIQKMVSEIHALSSLPSSHIPQPALPESEKAPSESAWQHLLSKTQALFTIQKRDSVEDLSQVQSLMKRDVLIQRALLLVDRIDWALAMGSQSQLIASKQALASFMEQYFPQNQTISGLLAQIEPDSLTSRQALQIAEES